MNTKFGKLDIGKRFWWNDQLFQKVDDCYAKTIRNGKTTDRRVEFHSSITIEIAD